MLVYGFAKKRLNDFIDFASAMLGYARYASVDSPEPSARTNIRLLVSDYRSATPHRVPGSIKFLMRI
jgi:hypothetical protein